MGRTEKRELVSRLSVLLLHLLKWRYQPQNRSPKSLEASIRVQRNRLADHLDDNPKFLQVAAAEGARLGLSRRFAPVGRGDRGHPGSTFPETCPWTVEQGAGRRVLAGVRGCAPQPRGGE